MRIIDTWRKWRDPQVTWVNRGNGHHVVMVPRDLKIEGTTFIVTECRQSLLSIKLTLKNQTHPELVWEARESQVLQSVTAPSVDVGETFIARMAMPFDFSRKHHGIRKDKSYFYLERQRKDIVWPPPPHQSRFMIHIRTGPLRGPFSLAA